MTARRFISWLARNSVWHHGNIEATEEKYRNLKRLVLPAYDLLVVACGLLIAFNGGLPNLLPILPPEIMQPLGVFFAAVGGVTLLGTVLPRFWRWEFAGRAVMVGIITSYVGALVALGFLEPDVNRLAVAAMAALALPLPLFRMDLIGDEIRERSEEGGGGDE